MDSKKHNIAPDTELAEAERKRMYEEDPVTGAYNMFSFLEHAEAERQKLPENEWGSLSLIYFNVSMFRIYNDTFGIEKGNECLRQISNIIRNVFKTDLTSRFYADHFLVYYTGTDFIDKIRICHERVLKLKKSFQLWLKAGIVHPTRELPMSSWSDNARIACDAITLKGLDYYKIYTKSLSDDLLRKKYIQDNIDKAIRHGMILIYYQPVVRTLTGEICGAEALARWDDPVYGFLSPDVFVPALEERHLSYKLDTFVVNRVCHDISERKKKGQPVVPVSVNFSRRDFAACDPLEIVENAIAKYDIGHEYLNIEITESAVMEDPAAVHDLIDRFHHAGYQVWMDDFGSAYSSLNALSEFDFDEIKLDLVFMQNFNRRTQAIVRQIVNMAKELHIHTLAEGVETKEQLDFLKDAGCEKIQGFYYGRPLPLKKQLHILAEKHMVCESVTTQAAFDQIGYKIFPSDQMFLIVSYKDKRFHIIYHSPALRKHFDMLNYKITSKEMETAANTNRTSIGINLRSAGLQASVSSEVITTYIAIGSRNLKFDFQGLAQIQDFHLLWIDCTDITASSTGGDENRYSAILRNITNAYHTVYRVDMVHSTVEVIRSEIIGEKTGDLIYTMPNPALERLIYWADLERFRKSAQPDFIIRHLEDSRRGFYTIFFRMKYPNGEYLWTEGMVIGILLNGQVEYLCCLKDLSPAYQWPQEENAVASLAERKTSENAEASPAHPKAAITEKDLWNSLIHQADLEFFWKDTNTKIIGASDSYFRNRHIEPRDVIGKADHTLGWHINDRELQRDDENVLKHGKVIIGRLEEFSEGGRIHHIRTSKFPIYHEGNIHGIMGYISDPETDMKDQPLYRHEQHLMSTGIDFIHAYADYEANYASNRDDYSLAIVYVPSCQKIEQTYGQEAAEDLVRQIRNLALQDLDKIMVLSRVTKDIFVVLSRSTNLPKEVDVWCGHMKNIRSAGGHPCTIRGYYGTSLRSKVVTPYQMYTTAFSSLSIHDGSYAKLSMEMLRLRIVEYQKIFDVVQLIDPRRQKRIVFDASGYTQDDGDCWAAMGGKARCLNCSAVEALRSKKNTMKLENFDDSFYVVRDFYVEVDDSPCVIECAQRLERGLFNQPGGKNLIANRLSELNFEVYTDRLTNVRNRRFYEEQLEDSTAEAVAFIDIDNFKHYNDTYGHHAGDVLLQHFAKAVSNALRSGEQLARYGGDEFIIVYDNMSSSDALLRSLEQVQENIANIRIQEPGLQRIRCTASIGAVWGRGIVKDMIRMADRQLYKVKATNKGQIYFGRYVPDTEEL